MHEQHLWCFKTFNLTVKAYGEEFSKKHFKNFSQWETLQGECCKKEEAKNFKIDCENILGFRKIFKISNYNYEKLYGLAQ